MHKRCDADDTKQCKTCLQYGWECTFNDVCLLYQNTTSNSIE